jgi:tetratricopeptide (TPR) repeat protein
LNVTGTVDSEESLKGKIIIYNNLALNYKALSNISKAIENVDKSEEIISQLGLDGFEFFTLTSLAEIYSKLNDFEAAEGYLLKAIETDNLNNNTSKLKDAQFLLYELYTKFKKFEKALLTYKSYKLLTDSIINYDITERLAEFQTVYEMEKRNKENDALKTANRLQRENAKLERQSFILTSLIS